MAVTRQQIRQALLDEDITGGLYGTATAAAPLQLTDATLLKVAGNSTSRYGSFYLYRPEAANASDYVRRITPTGYDPVDGELTHSGPAWTVNPLASSDSGYYEIWPWNPLDVNRALERALTRRCFSIQQDSIATNGQSLYQVSASPVSLSDIESDDQILEVAQVHGTDPNARISVWPKEGKTWWPEPDNDVLYIRFDTPPTGTIRITWKKPYAALDDESTTSTVDKQWAQWAMAFELFTSLKYQAKSRGETSVNYEELQAHAYNLYWGRRKKYMNRFSSQLITPRPRWKSRVPAPRMGRGFNSSLGGDGGMTVSV